MCNLSLEVVKTVIVGMFALLIIILISGSFFVMIDHVKPVVDDLKPDNASVGMSPESYESASSTFENTLKIIFYLAIAGLMVFVVIKILFEKETTSSYYG